MRWGVPGSLGRGQVGHQRQGVCVNRARALRVRRAMQGGASLEAKALSVRATSYGSHYEDMTLTLIRKVPAPGLSPLLRWPCRGPTGGAQPEGPSLLLPIAAAATLPPAAAVSVQTTLSPRAAARAATPVTAAAVSERYCGECVGMQRACCACHPACWPRGSSVHACPHPAPEILGEANLKSFSARAARTRPTRPQEHLA